MRIGAGAWLRAALVAAFLGGCGSSGPTILSGDPGGYLIGLDQLGSPDFTVYRAAAPVSAGWLDESLAAAVRGDGFTRAAEVEYYRQAPLDTSNGPITLTSAAASFSGVAGAASAMSQLDSGLDGRPGAVPVSAGSLGDAAHAVSLPGSLNGLAVVQIILVWRVVNVVNSLVAEGRSGGLQLDQLLPMAGSQTSDESGR